MTSVVIVGHGHREYIPYQFRALELQSTNDFEVVYVENGTNHEETGIQVLKRIDPKFALKIIVNKVKLSDKECWELAVNRARGDLVIFLNGDVIPDRYLVESYQKFNDGDHLLVGVNHTIHPNKLFTVNVVKALSGFEHKLHWHPLSRMVWQLDIMSRLMDDLILDKGKAYYLTSSDNMAVPKDIYNQVKPLEDPVDVDLGFKAYMDGYSFRYVPAAIGFKSVDPSVFKERDKNRKEVIGKFMLREKTILGSYGKMD